MATFITIVYLSFVNLPKTVPIMVMVQIQNKKKLVGASKNETNGNPQFSILTYFINMYTELQRQSSEL